MSYAIGNVIFGLPLTSEAVKWLSEENSIEPIEDDEILRGIEFLYSAGGDRIGFCGVLLGLFDECAESILVHTDGYW